MLIEDVEQFKEWLTASLSPICEADPGALAKYVVALVKKDKELPELKESCVDQLEVFLQTKTKDFVDSLFEVIDNKSYIVKTEEPEPPAAPLPDSAPPVPPAENDATPTSSDQQLVTSTSKIDIKREEELQKAFPIIEKRPKSKSRSVSPKVTRPREEERRRRPEERRNYDRGYPRRRSTSPRIRRYRSRSPFRRRSPFRPVRRSRSPGLRGVGRGRSRSRSWTRSRSYSKSPRRSWSRSRSRERMRSPGGRIRSRSPGGRIRSRSPGGRIRSRSPGGRIRSRSPGGRIRSRSPGGRIRSRSPGGRIRSRSPAGRVRSRSPDAPFRPRSPGGRSPRREVRARSPRGRSPYRHSVSPRFRSRSPRKRSRSPGFAGSRSPRSRSSLSPNRSRSRSPVRKVRRSSQDSRGPTPTQENGFADSTNPTPTDSHSSISVVTHTTGRYSDGQSASRMRCRDYDEKGFCVRGDLCVYDHGNDPVVVENVTQYPPGPPPPLGGPPHPPGPPPPPGHPMHMNIPPPGFFSNRMPGPPIHVRPDFPQEPYNPEAPGLTRPGPPPYWPGGPDMPPFMKGPPPPVSSAGHVPVKSRLGNRDLVNLSVRREVKDEAEDEDAPSSSTRTVIAPKDEPPLTVTVIQPPPPGVPASDPVPPQSSAPGPQQGYYSQQQRFHPYQRFPGPRKPFDYNRIGGYRRPDQTNCTLEVRKIPQAFNNIAKLNEHFGKFGTLTNIQVSFEGDPEAALVTFSSNQEALSCYKCSEPVFNNRFIKVFWHQKNKENGNQDASSVSTTTQGGSQEDSSLSMKSRLGPIPPASKMQLNNLIKKSMEASATTDTSPTNTQPEQTVTYTSSVGNVNKVPYNQAAAAMAVAAARAKAQAAQAALSSPTAVKAADFVLKMEKVKQMEAMKKEAAAKKLEIQKHKQELLEKQIEQQKKLIATLEKNKDMKETNKKAIMETLKTLSNSIDKLKTELSGRNVVLKSDAAGALGVKSPEQAKKEILDVELELMTKSSNSEETLELKKKLNELTKVANSMGLLGRGRGRGSVARGRAATTWVASGITPPAGPPGFGRGRGRGALLGKAAVATRTLDRRPKIVEVTGFDIEEKDEITSHLNGLKEVEKLEFNTDIPCAIVSFKTRRDAEMGILHGSKFKTKTLKMNWHIPKPDFSRSVSANSASTEDHEEIDEEALLAGVEDEEEETEDRSWRP